MKKIIVYHGTAWCLTTPDTAMWGESDEFIVDEFFREIK